LRLDKFLKVTQLIKRRSVANEAAGEGVISVNGAAARPSKDIKPGDSIVIDMWNYRKVVRVNAVPTVSNIPKASVEKYITVVEYTVKS
jgi:ribosomal 50S subunit-recycling heat shock protein